MKITLSLLFLLNVFFTDAAIYITVAKDGSGDFKTINEAIFSLPMFNYERAIIFIKNGVYNEKFRIDQDFVTLRGESREKTIIQYNQPRPQWLANKDSVGPGVINIYGDDIVIENLTVENTQADTKIHAFVIYGFGTRIILQNSSFISKGGDTVSLWDYKTGLYYHANCTFVGAVDFVCPRGWCYIKDSKFFEVTNTAAIWHAGGFDKDQKFVISNSWFDGVKGFDLGRHHYDAQFYLIDCNFSDSMSEKPIYRVVNKDPKANRAFNWGERYYYYNCHRKGGDFKWFSDNLDKTAGHMKPGDITCNWTFNGKWFPESVDGPKLVDYRSKENILFLVFNELITLTGEPVLVSKSGKSFKYDSGRGSNTLMFKCDGPFTKADLYGLKISNGSRITGTIATVAERTADLKIN